MSTMTATEIGAAIAKNPSSAECDGLSRELDARNREVKARIEAIAPNDKPERDPPARREALLTSTEAVLALDRELELLRIELDQIDRLGYLLHEARERALTEEARRDIPIAARKLPKLMDRARQAAAAYDATLAELQAVLDVCREFDRLESREMPYSDDVLRELLEIREAAWRARLVHVPHDVHPHEGRAKHPKSWPLVYAQHGDAIRRRNPPRVEEWEDWHDGGAVGSLRHYRQAVK